MIVGKKTTASIANTDNGQNRPKDEVKTATADLPRVTFGDGVKFDGGDSRSISFISSLSRY